MNRVTQHKKEETGGVAKSVPIDIRIALDVIRRGHNGDEDQARFRMAASDLLYTSLVSNGKPKSIERLEATAKVEGFISLKDYEQAEKTAKAKLTRPEILRIVLPHLKADLVRGVPAWRVVENYKPFRLLPDETRHFAIEVVEEDLFLGRSLHAAGVSIAFGLTLQDVQMFKELVPQHIIGCIADGHPEGAAKLATAFHMTERELSLIIERINAKPNKD